MANTVRALLEKLSPDEWRVETGFSEEVRDCNERLCEPSKSDFELSAVLRQWLRKHQPCLFGRIAAGDPNLLSFCILTDRDLCQSDEQIRDKIQEYRLHWKRAAYLGKKSGFIILAASPRIISALPDPRLLNLATRLCELYLCEEILPDRIYHDSLTLELPGGQEHREWNVGVNFFSAQGDKRWWLDHRIPGGLAFSMNSVGHMVKSAASDQLMPALEKGAKIPSSKRGKLKVNSLGAALQYAMLTISRAQEAPSGKATKLIDLTQDEYRKIPRCPLSIETLPRELYLKDFRKYLGWYHTDVTLPTAYFRSNIDREKGLDQLELDFTYLYDWDVDNPSFLTMGEGIRTK